MKEISSVRLQEAFDEAVALNIEELGLEVDLVLLCASSSRKMDIRTQANIFYDRYAGG